MALMKCGKCGNELPDKASTCPSCAAPVATPAQAEQTPSPMPRPEARHPASNPSLASSQADFSR